MKITYIRGDTAVYQPTVVDAAGAPIDITGATVTMTVNTDKSPIDDSGAIIKIVQTSHTDPTNGITQLKITNAIGQNLVPGKYWYDIQVIDPEQDFFSRAKDLFIIESDISRSVS